MKLSPEQMARTTQENRLRGATAAARKSARTAVVQARTRARTQVRGVRGERCERVIMLHRLYWPLVPLRGLPTIRAGS